MTEKRILWLPIMKSPNGDRMAILSDDSIDRDDEIIGDSLLNKWVQNKSLPMLADHTNNMKNFAGGWTDFRKTKSRDGAHNALAVKPNFFKSNPNTAWMEKTVEEAEQLGIPVGVSIGALPTKFETKSIDGKDYKMWTDAELVEASLTPVASNRNARFYRSIAKAFDLSFGEGNEADKLTKPKKVDDCVKALMADPDFKPQKGKTKEESAWAVCQAKFGKKSETDNLDIQDKNLEEDKMEEKNILEAIEKLSKSFDEKFDSLKKEVDELKEKEPEPEPEPVAEPAPEPEPEPEAPEVEAEKKRDAELNKGTVDTPSGTKTVQVEIKSLDGMLCAAHGRMDLIRG